MCQSCCKICLRWLPKCLRALKFLLLIGIVIIILGIVYMFQHEKSLLPSHQYLIDKFHSAKLPPNTQNSSLITMDDVCITVKTSKKYHHTRVELILQTWYRKANQQVIFVTDYHDPIYLKKTDKRMFVSDCGITHSRYDLCCKLATEYGTFLTSSKHKKWWCHFDDDNYVNIAGLLDVLNHYNWKSSVYIGRRSRDHAEKPWFRIQTHIFEFGTGGAGFCITRQLAEDMKPWCRKSLFPKTCFLIDCPDDCAMGFVITNRLNVSLSESFRFHSHLEILGNLDPSTLKDQVSLSYNGPNVIRIPSNQAAFTPFQDPTRMLSLHCLIYPHDELCP